MTPGRSVRAPAGNGSGRRDEGSASAELAASMPALALLLFMALGAVTALRTQVECVDAAREAVLAASRGEDGALAAVKVAPTGASLDIDADADMVRATVSVRLTPLGAHMPAFTVTGSAVAAMEPSSP